MGYYGEEKIKQMSRSILPAVSQSRKGIKHDLDARRRHNRRVVNDDLEVYRGVTASEAEDLYDDLGQDLEYYVEMHQGKGWRDIVQERRDHDHLNHFIRWAKERSKHLPEEERYDYIKSLMPDNAMGDHAMQHLEFELKPPLWRTYYSSNYFADRKKVRNDFLAELYKTVGELARNDHRRRVFNDYLIRHCQPVTYYEFVGVDVPGAIRMDQWSNRGYLPHTCEYVRTIHGYHDAKRFVDDIRNRCSARCEIPFNSVLKHQHDDWLFKTLEFLKIELPGELSSLWPLRTRK